MPEEFAISNIVLSIVTGGLIGLWWAMKMKRPRTWWSIGLTVIVLLFSPLVIQGLWLVYIMGTGIILGHFFTTLMGVILIGALARWARQHHICFNTHPK